MVVCVLTCLETTSVTVPWVTWVRTVKRWTVVRISVRTEARVTQTALRGPAHVSTSLKVSFRKMSTTSFPYKII